MADSDKTELPANKNAHTSIEPLESSQKAHSKSIGSYLHPSGHKKFKPGQSLPSDSAQDTSESDISSSSVQLSPALQPKKNAGLHLNLSMLKPRKTDSAVIPSSAVATQSAYTLQIQGSPITARPMTSFAETWNGGAFFDGLDSGPQSSSIDDQDRREYFHNSSTSFKTGESVEDKTQNTQSKWNTSNNNETEKSHSFMKSVITSFSSAGHRRSTTETVNLPRSHSSTAKARIPAVRSNSALPSSPSTSGSSSAFSMNRRPTFQSTSPSTPQTKRRDTSYGQVKETSVMVRTIDPETGQKMINRYLVLHELGRGVHGKVKLCVDTETGEQYALKIVQKKGKKKFGMRADGELDKIKKEIAIMKKLKHPNVVTLFEVIDDPNQEKIYMVLEYVDGGELQWKNEFDDPINLMEDIKSYILDLVVGVEYLHYQGIIHRDIKPQNILITSTKHAKIGDFGVSFFSEKLVGTESSQDAELAKTAGSPAFFAPELCLDDTNSIHRLEKDRGSEPAELNSSTPVDDNMSPFALSVPRKSTASDFISMRKSITLSEQPAVLRTSLPLNGSLAGSLRKTSTAFSDSGSLSRKKPLIGKPIDVWAIGVTLYCLVYGRLPFNAANEFELFAIIPTKPVKFPADTTRGDLEQSDHDLFDLFEGLFQKDPEERITLDKVKRHPWLRSAIPGQTDAEKDQWLSDSDPEVYCKKLKESDPEGVGKFYDEQGRIQVTEAEINSAVSVGVVLRRLVEAVKRKLSRGFSWFGTISGSSSAIDGSKNDRRTSSRSSLTSKFQSVFRGSSQQLFAAGGNSNNGSFGALSVQGAREHTNASTAENTASSFESSQDVSVTTGNLARDKSSMDFNNYLIRPRLDEDEAATEPLSLLRLKLGSEHQGGQNSFSDNRRTNSENNLSSDKGFITKRQSFNDPSMSPLATTVISEDDSEAQSSDLIRNRNSDTMYNTEHDVPNIEGMSPGFVRKHAAQAAMLKARERENKDRQFSKLYQNTEKDS